MLLRSRCRPGLRPVAETRGLATIRKGSTDAQACIRDMHYFSIPIISRFVRKVCDIREYSPSYPCYLWELCVKSAVLSSRLHYMARFTRTYLFLSRPSLLVHTHYPAQLPLLQFVGLRLECCFATRLCLESYVITELCCCGAQLARIAAL